MVQMGFAHSTTGQVPRLEELTHPAQPRAEKCLQKPAGLRIKSAQTKGPAPGTAGRAGTMSCQQGRGGLGSVSAQMEPPEKTIGFFPPLRV